MNYKTGKSNMPQKRNQEGEMNKKNLKNVLLAIVVLFVLSLVIWNTIALNDMSEDNSSPSFLKIHNFVS